MLVQPGDEQTDETVKTDGWDSEAQSEIHEIQRQNEQQGISASSRTAHIFNPLTTAASFTMKMCVFTLDATNRQQLTHKSTPTDSSLQSDQPQSACLWTVGGRNPLRQNMLHPGRPGSLVRQPLLYCATWNMNILLDIFKRKVVKITHLLTIK